MMLLPILRVFLEMTAIPPVRIIVGGVAIVAKTTEHMIVRIPPENTQSRNTQSKPVVGVFNRSTKFICSLEESDYAKPRNAGYSQKNKR